MITLKRDEREKESEASAVKRGRWTKEDSGAEKKAEAEGDVKEDKAKTEEEQMETTTETAAEVNTGKKHHMTCFQSVKLKYRRFQMFRALQRSK